MPKVTITNNKGLVQSSGAGLVVNSALNSTTGLTLLDSGGALNVALKSKRTTVTVVDNTQTIDTTGDFIPAYSKVIGLGVNVDTAGVGGNWASATITDWGLDGDSDYFNIVGATLANTKGLAIIGAGDGSAPPISGFFSAADEVRITVDDPGTQTTAMVVGLTLWYYDLSDTSG